jgi:hypothetical protein
VLELELAGVVVVRFEADVKVCVWKRVSKCVSKIVSKSASKSVCKSLSESVCKRMLIRWASTCYANSVVAPLLGWS